MALNNEETLKKWANVFQNNNLTQLCPILTAEETIQQTGESNVPVTAYKENIFQLPVPWRKKDDVHPYKASVQPLAPITFTSNQNFPKPMPLASSGGSKSQCTCQCTTISSPMGQAQKSSVGPTSSIKPTSQCLTKPMLWKEDVDEPICTCPKIPLPLIKPDPKRPFVKCECNELMRNVAPTNYKCSQPKPEVKMKPFLDKDQGNKAEVPTAGPDQTTFSPPKKSDEDKGEVCCCCEEGTKKGGTNKSEKQEESEKDKVKNKNGDNKNGGDDKKTIKKHGKDEVEKRKKMENNGNKDKKTEKNNPKEENKENTVEKEKMENKKKQNDGSSKKPDSNKSISSTPSSNNKTESSKPKAKNVKKLAADKKDPPNEQASPDTSPSIDESKTSKRKDKKSKKEMDVKKETKEKRGKESDCLKRINELTSKLPPDFVADFAQGMYPGMKVGHATCCLPSIRIPCKMGWLWNSCEGAGQIKPDLGWRPGAIRASTFSAMKAGRKLVKQNKQYEEEEIMSDEKKGDGDQGRKDDLDDEEEDSDLDDDDDDEYEGENEGKRRRSKPSFTTKEEEKEEQTKPTLHLHKTKGQYFISMYTPDEKDKEKEDEGRVLMTFNRKTLEICSSASSTSSGKSSTVTEDSMELDYTTPYALYKQAKHADQCNRQTQWNKL